MVEEANDIWNDDLLDRRHDAEFLATFLRRRSEELVQRGDRKAYVLNIDADWGAGKTFFLTRLQRQLKAAGHVAVYVNAWRDDFADDPLVAVMSAIDEETSQRVKKASPAGRALAKAMRAAGPVAIEVGKGLLYRTLGLAITAGSAEAIRLLVESEPAVGAGDAASEKSDKKKDGDIGKAMAQSVEKALDKKAENAVAGFRDARASIEDFRTKLAAFIEAMEGESGVASPFFVLVDELDRCRPPYAIATLERVKHLFETPRVVFVVATDSSQLVHSIGAVYGQGFDGHRYLMRFFDRVYTFARPSTKRLVAHWLASSGIAIAKLNSPYNYDNFAFIEGFFEHLRLDVRSMERMFDILRTIGTVWKYKVPVELALMLPMIAVFVKYGPNKEDYPRNMYKYIQEFSEWNIDIVYTNEDDRTIRENTSVTSFSSALLSNSRIPLNALPRDEQKNSGIDWALGVLRSEYRVRFDGTHYSQDPPKTSVLLDYLRIIGQAGRLTNDGAA